MKKLKCTLLTTLLLTLFCPSAVLSQCFNTEEQYVQKAMDMQEQCEKIKTIVPCAVGFRDDYPFQDKVLSQADDAALIELAKNVEAFMNYHSKDSVYMDDDVQKRIEENVSIVNVKQRLINTKSLKKECVSYTKNGKTLYRGVSLRVLDIELYKEATGEIKKIENEETASTSKSDESKRNASLKTNDPDNNSAIKKIATAAGKVLLRMFGL